MKIRQIQQALSDKGFNPGPIDGIMGAKTRRAIRAFQSANGLVVDGIVGRNTIAKLSPPHAGQTTDGSWIPSDIPWMSEAARLVGIEEIPGPTHNPKIMNWASELNVGYASDEVAWCGLFTAQCVASQMPDEPLPANVLGARQWLQLGESTTPCFGSVLVFWRVARNDWRGHVGLYWAEDETHYHVLGGNQSNKVSIKRIHKTSRFLDARWPSTSTAQKFKRHGTSDGVGVSITEA